MFVQKLGRRQFCYNAQYHPFVQKLCRRQFCYNASTTLFYSNSNFISFKFSDSVIITYNHL